MAQNGKTMVGIKRVYIYIYIYLKEKNTEIMVLKNIRKFQLVANRNHNTKQQRWTKNFEYSLLKKTLFVI